MRLRLTVVLTLLAIVVIAVVVFALGQLVRQPSELPVGVIPGTELLPANPAPPPHGDLRRYMHGISAIHGPGDDEITIFYSSSPPGRPIPEPGEPWLHDVFALRWNRHTESFSSPQTVIAHAEAQEPVSVAQNAMGHILITFEDGWNTTDSPVTQRYGVYAIDLQPILPYPQEVEPGGHSGQAAAVGDYFIVFYSDGWEQGGGVDNLGSGLGVYAKVYNEKGELLHDIDVAHAEREWWPVIAGGPHHALLVWQRFIDDATHAELRFALLEPGSGEISAPTTLNQRLQYYTYAAAWVPEIARFIVVATTVDGHGAAYLIDERGDLRARLDCMPKTIRESSVLVQSRSRPVGSGVAYGASARIYTPTPGGLLQLEATPNHLQLAGILRSEQAGEPAWYPTGSLGLAHASGAITWLATSPYGIQAVRFGTVPGMPGTGSIKESVATPC